MYEFHGWLRSSSEEDIAELRDNAPGGEYDPMFVGRVNGSIHVHFSGNPSKDRGEIKEILSYFLDGTFQFHGLVYINDSDAPDSFEYRVLKIFQDKIFKESGSVFSKAELQEIFG